MKRSRGVSIIEYGLIGATVVIVALPAFLTLGQRLSSSFEFILPKRGAASVPVAMIVKKPLGNGPATKAPAFAGGSNFEMPAVPSILSTEELTTTVQTAGVNGTTTMLADSLVSVAKQQLEDGSIDENLYNSITDLANQGHKLADIEASIEAAAKAAGKNGGGTAFYQASADLNGKAYNGPQLVNMLKSDGSDVQRFQKLQTKVLDETEGNPALQSILSQLSGNILNVADASAKSGEWIGYDGAGINTYQSFVDDLPGLIGDYSRQTTANSNDICSKQPNSAACKR